MVKSVVEEGWKLVDRKGGLVYSKRCPALADDYRQKLNLNGKERIKSLEFILQVDREANAETNIFETEHVVRQSVKPKLAAVSLAMSKPAGFPFRLEIDQSLTR